MTKNWCVRESCISLQTFLFIFMKHFFNVLLFCMTLYRWRDCVLRWKDIWDWPCHMVGRLSMCCGVQCLAARRSMCVPGQSAPAPSLHSGTNPEYPTASSGSVYRFLQPTVIYIHIYILQCVTVWRTLGRFYRDRPVSH